MVRIKVLMMEKAICDDDCHEDGIKDGSVDCIIYITVAVVVVVAAMLLVMMMLVVVAVVMCRW